MPARRTRLAIASLAVLALGGCFSRHTPSAFVHPRGSGNTVASDSLGSRMVTHQQHVRSTQGDRDSATAFVEPE
ncbi:MAG: hypothetical protein SFY69_08605 [Planctomycetota bacterium]|nr:hypothetical protein [Planctomycetota bacterium]